MARNIYKAMVLQITSLSLTAGGILGRLANFRSLEEGYVSYELAPGENEQTRWQAVFYRRGDSYYLLNRSMEEHRVLTISFPSIGPHSAETHVIPGMWEYRLDHSIIANAKKNNSRFFLSYLNGDLEENENQYTFVLEACGKNLVIGNGEFYLISPYLQVRLDEASLTLKADRGAALLGVTMAAMQHGGDTGGIVLGHRNDPREEENEWRLSFPCEFSSGDLADLSLVAVMGIAEVVQNQMNGQMKLLTEREEENRMSEEKREVEVGFNWGGLVTSLIPTVGTIVGQLLDKNSIEDGVLCYRLHQNGDAGSGSSYFYTDGGRYHFINADPVKDNTVTLAFPNIGENIGPETLVFEGQGDKLDVTDKFKETAQQDNSYIEMTGGGHTAQGVGGGGGVQISSAGYRIKVDGLEHPIGSFVNVVLKDDQITLRGEESTVINSVSSLVIKTSGDSEIKIMDAGGQAGKEIKLGLPEPLNDNDLVDIKFVGRVSTGGFTSAAQKQITKATPDLLRRINEAKKLNWESKR